MMLEVIEDIKILLDLELELEEVYKKHQGWSFNSPYFFLTAYKHFHFKFDNTRLFFIIMRKNNKVVSYIPLYIDRKNTLRFIFDKHTDFCGVIGEEPDFNFFKDFSKVILNESKINKINLDNFLPDDPLLNAFKYFLGPGTLISSYNSHSYISSTLSDGFLGKLKSKEKSELKRVQKKNMNFHFEIFDGLNAFPEIQMIALRDEMIATKSRKIDFLNDSYLSFSKLLYDAGELEVFTKWDNGNLISASMVLKKNKSNERMVWIDLYADVHLVNLSAYVDYIHHLEQYAPSVFSFGRGAYDYKTKNFQPLIQNLFNLRYSKSKFDFLFTNYYLLRYFLKRIIKK